MAIPHSAIPLVGGAVHYVLLTEVVYGSKQAPRKCNRKDPWPFHTVQSLVLEEEFMTSCLRRLFMVPSTLRGSVRGGIYGHSTLCNPSCWRRSSFRHAYESFLLFQAASTEVLHEGSMAIPHSAIPPFGSIVHYVLLTDVVYHSK